MQNSSKYFENRQCEYYPCHKGMEHINCMMCFCPLYDMQPCPGNYAVKEKDGVKIKTCINCVYPHIPENYDTIMKLIKFKNKRDSK